MGGDAGDIDDASFAINLHRGAKHLAGEYGAAHEVHVKAFAPIGGADLLKGVSGGDGDTWIVAARGVHQNGGSAQPVQQSFTRCFQRVLIEGISGKKSGRASLLST